MQQNKKCAALQDPGRESRRNQWRLKQAIYKKEMYKKKINFMIAFFFFAALQDPERENRRNQWRAQTGNIYSKGNWKLETQMEKENVAG